MSVETTKSERRRKTRKRPLTLVYVELASANGGMMRDLSEEGFAVRAMIPVRAGESTPFAFSLTEKIRIEGRGEIQWVKENGHVAGVRFLDLPASAREQIREWLIRPETPPKREAGPKELTLQELREEMHSVPARPEGRPSVAEPLAEPVAARAEAADPVEASAKPAAPEAEITKAKEPEAVVASEPPPVMPAPTREAEREPEPVVPTAVAKEPEPPVALPSAPVAVEGTLAGRSAVGGAATAPDVEDVPVESVPVASTPSIIAKEKTVEPVVAPEAEAKRDRKLEESDAPALPRLTLFGRLAEPEVEPAPSTLTASPEAEAWKLQWKPIPVEESSPKSEAEAEETQAPETPAALPDISSILMQPGGTVPKSAAAIPHVEALPSWDPESAPGGNARFSLANAIVLMSILALLASLYVFHKEVGQGLIWLGEQLGGVPESSLPAAMSTNTGDPKVQSEQPAVTQPDPSAQLPQTLHPTNAGSGNSGAEEQDTTAKSSTPPVSGAAPPLGSSPDAGENEYAQAMQLRKTRGAVAMQEVIRLLWVSVEKGNPNAELELAQMYWHGQGVIQNCDQAHILMTAAARKGSAEAQKRLVEFQRAGCE